MDYKDYHDKTDTLVNDKQTNVCEWCIWSKSYMYCGNKIKWRMIRAASCERNLFNYWGVIMNLCLTFIHFQYNSSDGHAKHRGTSPCNWRTNTTTLVTITRQHFYSFTQRWHWRFSVWTHRTHTYPPNRSRKICRKPVHTTSQNVNRAAPWRWSIRGDNTDIGTVLERKLWSCM